MAPEYGAYSETFIKAHYELLPFQNFFFHGKRSLGLPTMYGENHSLLTGGILLRISDKFLLKKRWHYSRVKKAFKRYGIDVVLAEYGTIGAGITPLCKELNIPMIVHFHGYDASQHYILKTYQEQYKEMFEYASSIIVVSEAMKEKLVEIGAPRHKVVLNPCGPHDSFAKVNPNYRDKTLIGIGRFVEKKAPYYTLLAFQKVLQQHPDARLIIGGDGVLLNICRHLVNGLGISGSVDLPGILSVEQFQKELSTARAFVQHSITAENGDMEGTPVAVLEAAASGVPVIATWHGGIPDVVLDGETGLLVEEHDVDGMAKHMQTLLEDFDQAKALGTKARILIQHKFTLDRHIELLSKLVTEAFEKKNL